MAYPTTEFSDDLEAIEEDSMIWEGTAYSGTLSRITKSNVLEEGGFVRQYSGTFSVRRELFTNKRPNVNQQITINGQDYAITEVNDDPDGVTMEIVFASLHGT